MTHAANAHELSITIDRGGTTQIDRQIFGPHGGNISSKIQAAINTPTVGCRIIHNHPAQGSLSASDWRLMATQNPGLDEMITVNSRGSLFRGKVVSSQISKFLSAIPQLREPSKELEQYVSAFLMAQYQNQLQTDPNAQSPLGLIDYISWMFSHIINERFAQIGWIEYRACLAADDQSDLQHPNFQKFVSDAKTEATRLFP
jgi:hypothetical protein